MGWAVRFPKAAHPGKLLRCRGRGGVGALLFLFLRHLLAGVCGVLREGNSAERDAEAKRDYEKSFHAFNLLIWECSSNPEIRIP